MGGNEGIDRGAVLHGTSHASIRHSVLLLPLVSTHFVVCGGGKGKKEGGFYLPSIGGIDPMA